MSKVKIVRFASSFVTCSLFFALCFGCTHTDSNTRQEPDNVNGFFAEDTDISRADEAAQAKYYAELFKLYKEYSKYIKRVTMWGMDDGTSWISAGNPCLFDWKLNAKKAFYAASAPEDFLAAAP